MRNVFKFAQLKLMLAVDFSLMLAVRSSLSD